MHHTHSPSLPCPQGEGDLFDAHPASPTRQPLSPGTRPSVVEARDDAPLGIDPPAAVLPHFESQLIPSLVNVHSELPLVALPDGVYSRSFVGSGLIVYQSDTVGLVLVDRNTVVISPGDIRLDLPVHPCEVEARAVFLHPLHNFAILR